MVLVDTSVWVRALSNKEPWRTHLDLLLDQELVAGHDLIYGELLIGHTGGRLKMLDRYLRMSRAKTAGHEQVVHLTASRNLAGRGAGWIDVHLVASALIGRMQLWAADVALAEIARDLGIEYVPGPRLVHRAK